MDLIITNDLSDIEKAQQAFRDFASSDIQATDRVINQLSVVLDEVLSNIINNGYSDGSRHEIEIHMSADNDYIHFIFQDDGIAFNPLLVERTKGTPVEEEAKIGGLGIQLMKRLVDDIEYQRNGSTNQLVVRKRLTL